MNSKKFIILFIVIFQFLTQPIYSFEKKSILHFMYVSKDRELVHELEFLKNKSFDGAQIMYSWKELEPQKNEYDFSKINEDIRLLAKYEKKLFIQLQDATFLNSNKAVPNYIQNKYFQGVVPQCNKSGAIYGWVSRRWDKKVQTRFHLLIHQLGEEFDGKVAGINLQETAIQVDKCNSLPSDFTYEKYRDAIHKNIDSLSVSFSQSIPMQYANFMPGEWLPWDNSKFLESVYKHAAKKGVAIGTPDLMPNNKFLSNHSYKFMQEYNGSIMKGVAVQNGNYHGATGNTDLPSEKVNIIPDLYLFASKKLFVNFIFWGKQEPYFTNQVIPFLKNIKE